MRKPPFPRRHFLVVAQLLSELVCSGRLAPLAGVLQRVRESIAQVICRQDLDRDLKIPLVWLRI